MAARIKRLYHPDEIKEKIKTSQLINLLTAVALTGKDPQGFPVTPVRIDAAKTLLKKVVPDLAAVEHSGSVEHISVREMTREQLEIIASSGSGRANSSPGRDTKPYSTH